MAHRDLECIASSATCSAEKQRLEPRYAELVYDGLWFSPLKQALDAFVDASQRFVTGEVRLRLEPGAATSSAGAATYSLYDYGLATYDAADSVPPRGLRGLRAAVGPRRPDVGGQAGAARSDGGRTTRSS